MSDFTEKENLNDAIGSQAETSADFEESTVFSAPTHHISNPQKNKKKLLPKILAAFLAVALLAGGIFAIVKLVPEKEDETDDTVFDEISVLAMESEEISKLTVTNSTDTIKFYSETVIEESESDSESATEQETTAWYIEGVEKELTDISTTESTIYAALNITASRKITEKTAIECGLDSTTFKLDVVPTDSEEFSILVGEISPDNSGYYLKLSNSDDIYLVDSSYVISLEFDTLDFASTEPLPAFEENDTNSKYFNNGTLSSFDTITISGKNFDSPLVIEPNGDEKLAEYIPFLIKSPTNRMADNVDDIFSAFSNGVTVVGAYAFDASANSIKEFGLNDPDLVIKMVLGNESITHKFKLQEDGAYAAVSDNSRMIYKVSSSTVESYIDSKPSDFYASWVCLYSLSDLSNFTVKTRENTYSFDIVSEQNEDASTNDYTISLNGNVVDDDSFKNFYQYCISLSCTDFTLENLSSEPDITLVFKFKSGADSVVEFIKVSETRYQYNVDGMDMGKITSASLNKVLKYAEKLNLGETFGEIN